MQEMFVLGLESALSKSDELAPREITRIGLQDDMTFVGSAAALNRLWNIIEGTLADAGHRLRGYKCGVWAPGFEQFEDALHVSTTVSARWWCWFCVSWALVVRLLFLLRFFTHGVL